MVMFRLAEGDVRLLMNMLLTQEVFDAYDARGCTIQSFARFDIEGASAQEAADARPVFCKWQRIRPYVYNIIKGNEKPRFLKIVLSLDDERLSQYPGAGALFVNIVFDKTLVHITTGASMKTFALDKTVENMWDNTVADLLRGLGLTILEE